MTLCLAWKQGNSFYFASDSRLTNSDKTVLTNYATKIFKIGVQIYKDFPEIFSAIPQKSIYQTTYGLCFSGSYLNGTVLANTIDNFLSNILIGPLSDISIDNLSNIAFAIYKQVSEQLISINRDSGLSEALFGGYCLKTNEFKLYKFYPKEITPNQLFEFGKEEINLNKQTVFLGDKLPKEKAEEFLKKIDKNYTHYNLLKEIIQDSSLHTVGGDIQIGCFQLRKFKTHGFVETTLFEDENDNIQIKDIYKFNGLKLDMEDSKSELFSGKIQTYEAFYNIFPKEKAELIKQQGKK